MITISIYAYTNNAWQKLTKWARPLCGSDRLDETLDDALIELKSQPSAPTNLPPFTPIKIVATDTMTTKNMYYVTGTPESDKVRMS